MTIIPGMLPRRTASFKHSGAALWFEINSENKMLGYCHWQKDKARPVVILLHGLEGSADSSHVLGIGAKAFAAGYSVLRLNLRNCGGSMAQAQTLYNAGMWQDVRFVMESLESDFGFKDFILVGYSLGGNLILNTAAHHAPDASYRIRAVCAVSPSIDLENAVEALELPQNRIYQDWFLRSMKAMILAKSRQFPKIYDPTALKEIRSIRDFDDRFTAPHGGYGSAVDYYREASALNQLKHIAVPALLIAAEDDPLVPINMFQKAQSAYANVDILISRFGGHCGFFQNRKEVELLFDQFWAENRVLDYIAAVDKP